LHAAALEGHKELVKLLRKHGARMDSEIFDVVQQGDLSKLKVILAEKPKLINAKDSYLSLSPLSWAAIEGNKEMAEYLIYKGADTGANNKTKRGASPLHWAR